MEPVDEILLVLLEDLVDLALGVCAWSHGVGYSEPLIPVLLLDFSLVPLDAPQKKGHALDLAWVHAEVQHLCCSGTLFLLERPNDALGQGQICLLTISRDPELHC